MQHVASPALGKQMGRKPLGWEGEGRGREVPHTVTNLIATGLSSFSYRGSLVPRPTHEPGNEAITEGAFCPFFLIPSHRLVWSSTFLLMS